MTERAKNGPLPRSPAATLHGFLLRAELQKLAKARLERGDAIDWPNWCYAAATTLDAVAPGRDRVLFMPSGAPYRGRYFKTWPECAPANFLAEGKNRIGLTLEEVPEEIVRAAEEACRRAAKRRWRTFLRGQTIGRLLRVTLEERHRLGLRLIGTIDASRAEQKADAMDRKRERDRDRDERKRREAGVKPRSETIAEEARKAGISPATMRKRLQREREKAANVTLSSPLATVPNVTQNSPAQSSQKGHANHGVKHDEMTHVTQNSPHKYRKVSLVPPEPEPVEADDAPTAAIIRFNPKGRRPVFTIANGSLFEAGYRAARRHGAQRGSLAFGMAFEKIATPTPRMDSDPEPATFAPPTAPKPDDESWRDWWRRPVEGWREGKLTIRNIVSEIMTEIDLRASECV